VVRGNSRKMFATRLSLGQQLLVHRLAPCVVAGEWPGEMLAKNLPGDFWAGRDIERSKVAPMFLQRPNRRWLHLRGTTVGRRAGGELCPQALPQVVDHRGVPVLVTSLGRQMHCLVCRP